VRGGSYPEGWRAAVRSSFEAWTPLDRSGPKASDPTTAVLEPRSLRNAGYTKGGVWGPGRRACGRAQGIHRSAPRAACAPRSACSYRSARNDGVPCGWSRKQRGVEPFILLVRRARTRSFDRGIPGRSPVWSQGVTPAGGFESHPCLHHRRGVLVPWARDGPRRTGPHSLRLPGRTDRDQRLSLPCHVGTVNQQPRGKQCPASALSRRSGRPRTIWTP